MRIGISIIKKSKKYNLIKKNIKHVFENLKTNLDKKVLRL